MLGLAGCIHVVDSHLGVWLLLTTLVWEQLPGTSLLSIRLTHREGMSQCEHVLLHPALKGHREWRKNKFETCNPFSLKPSQKKSPLPSGVLSNAVETFFFFFDRNCVKQNDDKFCVYRTQTIIELQTARTSATAHI